MREARASMPEASRSRMPASSQYDSSALTRNASAMSRMPRAPATYSTPSTAASTPRRATV